MKDVNKLSYVSERDIDLLLLEELNVNRDFALWLYSLVSDDDPETVELEGAWHSISNSQLGESDLVAIYDDGLAILIENKINASAQPDQALRYVNRGEEGCKDKSWKEYITCIVAPEKYLRGNSEAQIYHTSISYEQLREWFEQVNCARSLYRAFVLNEAIDQNRRGYSPVADQVSTQFWLCYWDLASGDFPELNMPYPGDKPARNDWPYFFPDVLGKEFDIVHKMAKGFVDLQINGAVERLNDFRALAAKHGFEVAPAGKSAAIRAKIKPIDRYSSFEDQQDAVREALHAATRLVPLVERIRNGI